MASLTINNLDPAAKARLRVLASQHGRTLEDEGGVLLNTTLLEQQTPISTENVSLWDAVRATVDPIGGIDDLELPSRKSTRPPFEFES